MSTTSPPVPLIVGKAAQLKPTDTVQQLAAVAVQNLSPYLLAVAIGNQSYSLPGYTSDLYKISNIGVPVMVLPSNPDNTSGVSANAIATWFGPDEIPDTSSYPGTLSAPPVAVGLAVAQQLLAGGVPNVLNETLLGPWILAAGASVTVDVSSYASLLIFQDVTSQGIAAESINWVFQDPTSQALTGFDQASQLANIPLTQMPPALVPVLAQNIILTNNAVTGGPVKLWMLGSNRATPYPRTEQQGFSSVGFQVSTGSINLPINANTQMNPDFGTLFQGPAFLDFTLTGTIAKGFWMAVVQTDNGPYQVALADTTEAHTTGPDTHLTKMAALPAAAYNLVWRGSTASVANAIIRGFPAY